MARSLKAARLREVLDYDPESGIFTWKIDGMGRYKRAGARAGTPRYNGRNQICIDRHLYMASNLAWLWMTNKWPSRLIDHINNDPSDDRWANLRQADYSQNGANSKARQGKTTPKGVTFDKRAGLYAARIKVNYRTINLGLFNAPEEAHAAYVAAARRYFGKFARTD